MHRAKDRTRTGSFTLAPGVHRPRRPQPGSDRTRASTHPKQARYSTDYAPICGTNIMRGTMGALDLGKASEFYAAINAGLRRSIGTKAMQKARDELSGLLIAEK